MKSNSQRFIPEAYIEIGWIQKAWGIDGSLKLLPAGSHPERFQNLSSIFLVTDDGSPECFTVQKIRWIKESIVITLLEIDNRNQAETWKNASVCVPESQSVQLDEWEFFHHSLLGLKVVDLSRTEIGRVKAIQDSRCNDILIIENDSGKEAFVPMVRDSIKAVDIDAGWIIIDPFDNMFSDDSDAV